VKLGALGDALGAALEINLGLPWEPALDKCWDLHCSARVSTGGSMGAPLGDALGTTLGDALGPALGKTLELALGHSRCTWATAGTALGPALGEQLGPLLGDRLGTTGQGARTAAR
jgi:hypothetical protein